MKRILIVTSKFPWPITGASEADRAFGIEQFIRLGYDIRVITKVHRDKVDTVQTVATRLGIAMYPVPYTEKKSTFKKYVTLLFTTPSLLDGAAYEYAEPNITEVFKKQYERFSPDIVWLDMTFMWPLIKHVDKNKTKVVTRSQNNEALHYWEEEKRTPLSFLMYQIKKQTEKRAAKMSDTVAAIVPHEKKFYEMLGAKRVITLPLRSMPKFLKNTHKIRKARPLHVFFAGSTYNVPHNKKVLHMLLKMVIPEVQKKAPKDFSFHIFGSKFPKEYEKYLKDDVAYEGYVKDYSSYMKKMDIAFVPSISGRGMQQKIFEPIARGIPTITSEKGIQGYSFFNNEHVILSDNPAEALLKIKDDVLRKRLSSNSINTSKKLFSKERLDVLISEIIN